MHAFIYSQLEVSPSPYTYVINPGTSIGIEEIRNAQKFLAILPPQNQINKLIVFSAEKMTLPAQNAFLKTLEEPPAQSEIYLVTKFPDQLLPTILSRVEIKSFKTTYASTTLENSRLIWQKLQNMGVGERLAVIDEQAFDRDSFLHFLSDLEYILSQDLSNPKLPKLYNLLTQTKIYSQSNCNLRLVIDYFITGLQLPIR